MHYYYLTVDQFINNYLLILKLICESDSTDWGKINTIIVLKLTLSELNTLECVA